MNRRTPLAETGTEQAEQNILVTCAGDGRTHVVPHAVLSESLAAGTGYCTAVCGHKVLPASLCSPPGSRCALCDQATAPAEPRRDTRRRRRAGLLSLRAV